MPLSKGFALPRNICWRSCDSLQHAKLAHEIGKLKLKLDAEAQVCACGKGAFYGAEREIHGDADGFRKLFARHDGRDERTAENIARSMENGVHAVGKGIGYLIVYGGQVFKLDLVMASTVILCMLATLMYSIVALFEKIIIKY